MSRIALIALALAGLLGCGSSASEAPVERVAVDHGPAECAVCGMTVRDQPAPRGQTLHRGGEHRHFCSLGDLRAWVQTPSSLGKPLAVWVEDLGPGFDAAAADDAARPWIEAQDAVYVVGIERTNIMGKPILSFSGVEAAEAQRTLPGARRTTWDALLTTPFHDIPPETP